MSTRCKEAKPLGRLLCLLLLLLLTIIGLEFNFSALAEGMRAGVKLMGNQNKINRAQASVSKVCPAEHRMDRHAAGRSLATLLLVTYRFRSFY